MDDKWFDGSTIHRAIKPAPGPKFGWWRTAGVAYPWPGPDRESTAWDDMIPLDPREGTTL